MLSYFFFQNIVIDHSTPSTRFWGSDQFQELQINKPNKNRKKEVARKIVRHLYNVHTTHTKQKKVFGKAC